MLLVNLEYAIIEELRGLPYPTYLGTMYAICQQYDALYSQEQWPAARDVVIETVALLRDAALTGGSVDGEAAARLCATWEDFDRDAGTRTSTGLLNVLSTCDALACELAGEAPRYEAVERCTLPFSALLSEGEEPPDLEVSSSTGLVVDDSRDGVQLLRRLHDYCRRAAGDPAQQSPALDDLRAEIFGAEPDPGRATRV